MALHGRGGSRHVRGPILLASVVLGLAILLVVPAVGVWATTPVGGAPPPATAPVSACPAQNLSTPICHVFVILMENRDLIQIQKHAPFQNYLAKKYALAAQFYSVEHYSLPAYLASTSGTVSNTIQVLSAKNVADLIERSHHSLSWASYLGGMTSRCNQTGNHNYSAAHNPFVLYSDIWNNQSRCRAHDLTFGSWKTAALSNHTPNYAFIVLNATGDCWKSNTTVCDAALKTWLSPQMNASFFKSSVFLITYDEGSKNSTLGANGTVGGGHVYTVAVSPYACPGFVSNYNYTHYNILTTTEWLLGLGRTGNNDNWSAHPPMKDLFCFSGPHLRAGLSTLPSPGVGSSIFTIAAAPRVRPSSDF